MHRDVPSPTARPNSSSITSGLDAIKDLPGLAELKGAGLLDGSLPPGFTVPEPTDAAAPDAR